MLLDLSEIFVCPRCRPTQGLVVLVDEIADRRVERGHLGCPRCEARYAVEGGTLRFGAAETHAPAGGQPALFRGASREEAAGRLGALLGLPESDGPFLLFPGLGALGSPLARLAEDEEVLALVGRAPGEERRGGEHEGRAGGAGLTRIVGASATDLPIFAQRVGGAALLGGPAASVEEAVRTVRGDGRVVVIEPTAAVRDAVDELPVEVVAEDARALVGVRRC